MKLVIEDKFGKYATKLKAEEPLGEAVKLVESLVRDDISLTDGFVKILSFLKGKKAHPVWDDLLKLDTRADVAKFSNWVSTKIIPATRSWNGIVFRMFQIQFGPKQSDLPINQWHCQLDATDFDFEEGVRPSLSLEGLDTIYRWVFAAESDRKGMNGYPDQSEQLCWIYLALLIAEGMRLQRPAEMLGEVNEKKIGICVIEYENDLHIGDVIASGWKPLAKWVEI